MTDLANPQHWLPGKADLNVIRTAINTYNSERSALVNTSSRRLAFVVGVYAAVAVAAIAWPGDQRGAIWVAFFVLVLLGASAWNWVFGPARKYEQQLRHRLFPSIFGFVSGFRYEHGAKPRFLDRFRHTGLFYWQKHEVADCLSGVHDGLEFEIAEVSLFEGNADAESSRFDGSAKTRTRLFNGLILQIRRKSPFPGLLVAQRKLDAVDRFFSAVNRSGLHSVSCGDPRIDATCEFLSDHPGTELQQLCIGAGNVFGWLSQAWHRGAVKIVLRGHDCYVLLDNAGDYFELPNIRAGDIEFDRDVLPVIKDMVQLLAIAHLVDKIGVE